jgi:hypothetical protein
MYSVFRDLEFDWVLNIDADEFLMIDRVKYPNGIADMVRDVEGWMISKGVPAPNLQMMAFNWICIDKLDIKPGSGTNSACTLQDMISGYPLHVYSYIKSFVKPSELPEKFNSEANCHNMITMANKVYGDNICARMCHVLGDTICEVTKHRQHINSPINNFKWGFILHLNTRSMANALTKSLVTQLRRRKQIADLEVFTTLINSVDTVKLESEDPTYKHGIMEQFKNQLNLKWWFPVKVRNYHNGYKDSITEQVDYATNILKTCKADMMNKDIVDRDMEIELLKNICAKLNINWEKCKVVLELF